MTSAACVIEILYRRGGMHSFHRSTKGHSQSDSDLGRRADGEDRGTRDVAALIQQVLGGGERLHAVSQRA
jgi:hypothetical protein